MMYMLAHNIVSPLGFTSEENFEAVCAGKSGLSFHTHRFGLPEPFCASLMESNHFDSRFAELSTNTSYTRFEKMALWSVSQAIATSAIDAASPEVVFVLSTTKGNVELLENLQGFEKERLYLWKSAQLIARFFGNPNEPVVVSNACISGCAAQIAAHRILQHPQYRYAVVVGAEVLSKFIISGFQSFKALSPEKCKPFDANRCGLNLGEAAATIIYESDRTSNKELDYNTICFSSGYICNDANHISGPSRTAEGQYHALENTLVGFDKTQLAFINAHGTTTRYNDDMESVAINRIGLQDIPVNSLKPYFGHTLGAAGIVEVIISSLALQCHKVIKTPNFETPGTVNPIHVADGTENRNAHTAFLKIISGFGGGNAALLFQLLNPKDIRS